MSQSETLAELRSLEEELLQPSTRQNPRRLAELLHEQFEEFGRTGKRYDRDTILREFTVSETPSNIAAQDFRVTWVHEGVALLTYVTAHVTDSGTRYQHTLRSSLWVLSGTNWQLRFHQGTPVNERG